MIQKDLNEEQVLAWLKANDDFLLRHPEVMTQATVGLPKQQDGATSLASYQIDVLRDKNKALTKKIHTLIMHADANEQLVARIHALVVALFRASSLHEAISMLLASLVEDFNVDQVVLMLGTHELAKVSQNIDDHMPGYVGVNENSAEWQVVQPLLAGGEVLTGRLNPLHVERLFGSVAESIQSMAVMPLEFLGVLAIGSEDPQRFFPGMGTLFLELLAGTLVAALHRRWDG